MRIFVYLEGVTCEQAYELETLQRITCSSDADMLRLARECEQDASLVHLGQLSRVAAGEMIAVLREYVYYPEVGSGSV